MIKVIKRFCVCAMLFFCLVSLVGCGDDGSNNNGSQDNGQGTDSQVVFDVGKISGYVANITNASAIGISNPNDTLSSNSSKQEKNTIIMSTISEEYESNTPEADESGLTKVSFTKIVTENITTEITGQKKITAVSKIDNVKIADYGSNSITIICNPDYEYKVIGKNGNSLSDWVSSGSDTYTFSNINYNHRKEITVKSRSLNAKVSFIATSGFTYKLMYENNVIFSDIQDNCALDKSSKEGIILLDGLIEGNVYTLEYNGIGQEVKVTQDEINAEIDKLFVYNNFTFMSFVPTGTSSRPSDSFLQYDKDGISTYDKCEYYSSSNRQSFIIDNSTGYVYPIKNFNIKEIKNGCLLSANDKYVYDFKINDNDEVEIFSLFQNDTIECYSCFKDKYGNKFIQNNRLNTYDSSTNTYFYVFNSDGEYSRSINYELTSNNEAIKLNYDMNVTSGVYEYISSASIVLDNGNSRSINVNDSFEIYYDSNKWFYVAYKVEKGIVYGYSPKSGYTSGFRIFIFNCMKGYGSGYNYRSNINSSNYVNVEYLEQFDITIQFINGKVCYSTDIWDSLILNCECGNGGYYDEYYSSLASIIVVEDCNLDNNKILTFGIDGNIYYDIVVEEVDGEVVVNKYISGTYIKEQIKIILQPLNKY